MHDKKRDLLWQTRIITEVYFFCSDSDLASCICRMFYSCSHERKPCHSWSWILKTFRSDSSWRTSGTSSQGLLVLCQCLQDHQNSSRILLQMRKQLSPSKHGISHNWGHRYLSSRIAGTHVCWASQVCQMVQDPWSEDVLGSSSLECQMSCQAISEVFSRFHAWWSQWRRVREAHLWCQWAIKCELDILIVISLKAVEEVAKNTDPWVSLGWDAFVDLGEPVLD